MKRFLFLFVVFIAQAIYAQYNDGEGKIFYYVSAKHNDCMHFCYFNNNKCYYTESTFETSSIMSAPEERIIKNMHNRVYNIKVAIYNPRKSTAKRKVYDTNKINWRTNEKLTIEFYNGRENCFWINHEYVKVEKEKNYSNGSRESSYVPNHPAQSTYNGGGYSGEANNGNGYVGGGNVGNNNENRKQKPTRHQCSLCNGTGKIVRESSIATFGNDTQVYCSVCGRSYFRSTGHSHVTCPTCHGKGYVEYRL